jgi:hypothetical protein
MPGADEQTMVGLTHVTLLEIRDFNALRDAGYLRENTKRFYSPVSRVETSDCRGSL